MKFGLFYQLPVAPGQSETIRYRETMEQIIFADEVGFDVAWLAEGHFYPPFSAMSTPLVVAAALSGCTVRIRLATGVSQLPLHHPVLLAEEAATVDILSEGRFDFGVGRGTSPQHFQAFGVPWKERSARFEEALDVIELVWNTEYPVYERNVSAKIAGLKRLAHLDQLICWFNPGGLIPHASITESMKRFATDVMPSFGFDELELITPQKKES